MPTTTTFEYYPFQTPINEYTLGTFIKNSNNNNNNSNTTIQLHIHTKTILIGYKIMKISFKSI